jgi:hypothetical protein
MFCAGFTNGNLGENAAPGADVFVIKIKPSGEVEWVTQLGATTRAPGRNNNGEDQCHSLDFDQEGNIYCGGHTTGLQGDGAPGANWDMTIVKLKPDGQLDWVRQFGTAGFDYCRQLKVFAGWVYCVGYASATDNSTTGNATLLMIPTSGDIPQHKWIEIDAAFASTYGIFDRTKRDFARSIAIDPSGKIFIAGTTLGSLATGRAENLNPDEKADVFLWRLTLDANHNPITDWVIQYPMAEGQRCLDLLYHPNDTLYCGGSADSVGGSNPYVMQFSSSGELLRTREFVVNAGLDTITNMALDPLRHVYVGGYTYGSLGETNGGDGDLFFIKLRPNLHPLEYIQLGQSTRAEGFSNSGFDNLGGFDVDYWGTIYAGGQTQGSMFEANGCTGCAAGINPAKFDVFFFRLDTNRRFE